jgi:hypothetical protein
LPCDEQGADEAQDAADEKRHEEPGHHL